MKFEGYKFQNIYLITTYRCNWECAFCLFRFNNEEETSMDDYINKLEYAIKDSKKKVYIKITGGEPFIYPNLLKRIIDSLNRNKDKIYKIGIGSNGSIKIPEFFNDLKIRTHIFLSRHFMDDILPTPIILSECIQNDLIDFRLNCNLINGQIDSLSKIKLFIEKRKTLFSHFCFRELSKVNVDINEIYPKQIYDYIDYYDRNLITIKQIEDEIQKDYDFRYSRNTGNAYDINHWYWYKNNISIKFRSIDETKLIKFNDNNLKIIDEYVIHPDGTLTGCWDKDRKIILKGGVNMPSRPFIPKPDKSKTKK